MVRSEGNTRKICDIVSRRLGYTFTARQLDNFRRYRLGGGTASDQLKGLLTKFESFDGTKCLIVHDQDKMVCGIVLQSGIQRAMFQRWGDSLILDWTHNTNNLGFYYGMCLATIRLRDFCTITVDTNERSLLGAFVVTTANGKGVSVCDFLCISQTKEMMRHVFTHFTAENQGAVTKVKSIVIDKDYNEWAILEEVFQYSTIVLCQFHVLKWLKRAITEQKYGIALSLRPNIMSCIHNMVYANTNDDLDHHKQVLDGLLWTQEHLLFRQYMQDRWYSCERMWSNALRGSVFTAGNTTSNRIESYWNQFKSSLGKKQRIDMCVEAVFLHATAVLRREHVHFVEHMTSVHVHLGANPFIQPLLSDLSPYAGSLVVDQFKKMMRRLSGYHTVTNTGSVYTVRTIATQVTSVVVDVTNWTCSCHFYLGHRLPCRHMLYVVQAQMKLERCDPGMISTRWSMNAATPMLDCLQSAIDEMSSLRLSSLGSTEPNVHDETTRVKGKARGNGSVAYVKLQRREVSDTVVLNDLEKRNIVMAQLAPLVEFMMSSGSNTFRRRSVHLDECVEQWLKDLTNIPSETTSDNEFRGCDDEVVTTSVDVEERDEISGDNDTGFEEQMYDEEDYATLDPVSLRLDDPNLSCRDGGVSTTDVSTTFDDFNLDQLMDSQASSLQLDPLGDFMGVSQLSQLSQVVPHIGPTSSQSFQLSQVDIDGSQLSQTSGNDGPTAQTDVTVSLSESTLLSDAGILATLPSSCIDITMPESVPQVMTPSPSFPKSPSPSTTSPDTRTDLYLPPIRKHGVTKSSTQQGKSAVRVATVVQASNCPVYLPDFVQMLNYSPMSVAAQLAKKYPVRLNESFLLTRKVQVKREPAIANDGKIGFVVSRPLLNEMIAAVDVERAAQNSREASQGHSLYAYTSADVMPVSEYTIAHSVEYYDTASRLADYELDSQWLSFQSKWTVPKTPDLVFFLQKHADEVDKAPNGQKCTVMRRLVREALEQDSLRARVSLCGKELSVNEMVGRVGRRCWLNDTVVNFVLETIAADLAKDVIVVNSLACTLRNAFVPIHPIQTVRLLVFPVLLGKCHWSLIMVEFRWIGAKSHATVMFYDPMDDVAYERQLLEVWSAWCLPNLKTWFERDRSAPEPDVLQTAVTKVLNTPKQGDGSSCGVFCVAQAYDYIVQSSPKQDSPLQLFQSFASVKTYTVNLIRLRIMWWIMCATSSYYDGAPREKAIACATIFGEYLALAEPKKGRGTGNGKRKRSKLT
jgi:hypothetical protein